MGGRAKGGQSRLERLMLWVAAIQLACAAGFALDLYLEFPDPRDWLHLGPGEATHLVSEGALMILLLTGFSLARSALRQVQRERDTARRDLRSLRGDFDTILHRQFEIWQLTPAQRDVALLTLRGATIADVAGMRNCAEGTVKAHLSAIFRAAGVRTRSELLGHFMDEFLDHGSVSAAATPIPIAIPDART